MPALPVSGMFVRVAALALAGFAASACSSIENPFDKSDPPPVIAPGTPSVVGAPEKQRITSPGGSGIAAFVNDVPVTSNQIKRRAAFLQLRRVGGNRTAKAKEELIDEALQMQEARRLNAVADDATVNEAYLNFAKSNRLTPPQLGQVLSRSGVTKRGFEEYIRAQISWQRALGLRQRAETGGQASADANRGPSWLPAVGAKTSQVNQYTLQQVVFVVPQDKRSLIGAKKTQANRFRASWRGCETAKAQAVGLNDVTVLDRGRVLATELPPRWREDVEATKPGGITSPKETEKGVEMLAVCDTRKIAAAVPAGGDAFSDENLRSEISALEKKYMDELREVATIETR